MGLPGDGMSMDRMAAGAMARDSATMPSGGAEDWAMPPMYEGVPMLPGVMSSRPRVRPLRPVPGARHGRPSLTAVDPTGLPAARPRQVVTLPDGGTLDLTAGFVRKEVAGRALVMLGFNEQIPGPLLHVREASTITAAPCHRGPTSAACAPPALNAS